MTIYAIEAASFAAGAALTPAVAAAVEVVAARIARELAPAGEDQEGQHDA